MASEAKESDFKSPKTNVWLHAKFQLPSFETEALHSQKKKFKDASLGRPSASLAPL